MHLIFIHQAILMNEVNINTWEIVAYIVSYKIYIIYVNMLDLTLVFESKGKSDYFPLPITERMKIWSYTAEDYVTGLLSW